MDAMISTVQDAFVRQKTSTNVRLNPDFRYLRVVAKGRVLFLALGYEDNDPLGPIEVWYSSEREVLRLQNGRLAGTTGMTTEWRSVILSDAPAWPIAMSAAQPLRWVRVRDVMPGYRYGIRDNLELRKIAPPKITVQGYDAQHLEWFEEHALVSTTLRSTPNEIRQPALYAVNVQNSQAEVVYGEQCVSADLCFSWQRWKPE